MRRAEVGYTSDMFPALPVTVPVAPHTFFFLQPCCSFLSRPNSHAILCDHVCVCVLPETLYHVGQVHAVGDSIRLAVVQGLQFLREHIPVLETLSCATSSSLWFH